MYSLRTTKTKSGATAVQVVVYRNNQTFVFKHIGSIHDQTELPLLLIVGKEWIETKTGQLIF